MNHIIIFDTDSSYSKEKKNEKLQKVEKTHCKKITPKTIGMENFDSDSPIVFKKEN